MSNTSSSSRLSAEVYEHQNVHAVYEAIAPHFSRTRHKPWPVVDRFLRSRAPGSVGLDIGCGNGKYLGVNPDVVMLGSDRSQALVNIAAQHYHSHPTSTQRAATSHHFPSKVTGSKSNGGGEKGLQDCNNLQKRSPQTHANHDQHQGEAHGRETRDERDPSRQQPDLRHHNRRSRSRQDALGHQIDRLTLDQHPNAGNFDTANDQSSSKSNNARSSDTKGKASTAMVIVADTLALPHPDCTFDVAICIAVIHHLSTRERRVQAISDIVGKLRIRSRVRSSGEGRAIRRSEGKGLGRSPDRQDAGDGIRRHRKSSLSRDGGSQNENGVLGKQRRKSEFGSAACGDGTSSDTQPGQALIYVWALEQKSSRRGFDTGDSQDQLVPWVLKPDLNAGSTKQHRSKVSQASASAKTNAEGQYSGRSEAELRKDDGQARTLTDDAITGSAGQHINQQMGEKVSEKTFHRFYHLYQEGELESECAEAGARVVERGYDRDNWWVVVEPGKEAEG